MSKKYVTSSQAGNNVLRSARDTESLGDVTLRGKREAKATEYNGSKRYLQLMEEQKETTPTRNLET